MLRRRASRPLEVELWRLRRETSEGREETSQEVAQSFLMARVAPPESFHKVEMTVVGGREALRVSTSQGHSSGQWLRGLLALPGEGARCYDGAINNYLQECRQALRASVGAQPREQPEDEQAAEPDDEDGAQPCAAKKAEDRLRRLRACIGLRAGGRRPCPGIPRTLSAPPQGASPLPVLPRAPWRSASEAWLLGQKACIGRRMDDVARASPERLRTLRFQGSHAHPSDRGECECAPG